MIDIIIIIIISAQWLPKRQWVSK